MRSLLNPRLREIHESIGGVLNMGDLAVYVGQTMSEAMMELAAFVEEGERQQAAEISLALEQSVKLQSHYAELLNGWDGGERMLFVSAEAWLDRLKALAASPSADGRAGKQ